MEFLAPLMLVGIVGAAIPIVIHLVGRRRAPVRRFGAIDFLLGDNRKVARRLRVRELVLLALRVAACAAIPLALAKPFVSCSVRGPVIQRGPQAVAVVLDDSFVMSYRQGGATLFDRAKARALKLLAAIGPEADVALVMTAEGSEPPVELSRDHLKLRQAIADAPLVMRPADLRRAVRDAAALLSSTPHSRRRVYVISPLTLGGFEGGDPSWPAGVELELVDVSGGELPNLAIVDARAEPSPDAGPHGLLVTAELANFGAATVFDRAVTVRVGGRAAARGLVTVKAGERIAKRFSISLPADVRSVELTLESESDGLTVDDRRYLHVELMREVRVLVVDGDPRTVRHQDETFYLETALRPGDRGDSALSVVTTTVDDLPRQRLEDFDVVFLCNVPPLAAERVAALEAWVRKGGGLFVSVGDNVEPEEYDRSMRPLLAQELRAPRAIAAGGNKAERSGLAERIVRVEPQHPIFSVFPEGAGAFRGAGFFTYYVAGPTTHVQERRTIARFAGGAPALVEARLGSGRMLLFASTVDRDWTDLPIHPAFLPLMQQAARYLARAPAQAQDHGQRVGRPRDLDVLADDRRLEVVAPSGRKTAFEAERLAGRTTVPYLETGEPGFYRVSARGSDGSLRPRRASDFVVNLDPRGSDTRRLAAGALPAAPAKADAADASNRAPGPPPRRRVELWHGLAAALLLFLLGEALLTR